MKKKLLFVFALVAFMLVIPSVNATVYEFDDWTDGTYYGTKTKVDDNITNIKGAEEATGGMFYGPYSKKSEPTIEEGIVEDIHIGIDFDTIAVGEFFELTVSLDDATDSYITEAVVMAQRIDEDTVRITDNGWASGELSFDITESGIYTFRWNYFVEEEIPYVSFEVLDFAGDSLYEIDDPVELTEVTDIDGVTVRSVWFCNVRVAEGVNVYTDPSITLTLAFADERESVEIPYGFAFDEDQIEEIIANLEDSLGEGYIFEGFYADEDFEEEFDFTEEMTDDLVVYIKVSEVKAEEENPKTADINLILVVGTLLVSVGCSVLLTKKAFNN